ncbi:PilN domain-containing protein [bacterium]|nr:PilN domain-containing protein [bacterium]
MIRINLLPTKANIRKENALFQLGAGAFACVFLMIVCFVINKSYDSKIKKQQATIADLKTKISRLASIKKQVNDFKKKKQDLESKIKTIEDLDNSRSGPVKLLEEFTYVLPEKAWLTEYKENNKRLEISGVAVDGPTVSQFVDQLNQSKFFKNIKLVQVEHGQQSEASYKRFNIVCNVNYNVGSDENDQGSQS